MNVVVQDGSIPSLQVIKNYPVDLAAQTGGNTAYIGFTAATGGGFANCDVLNWRFTPFPAPFQLLHSFAGDPATPRTGGALPNAQLAADGVGNLYGGTEAGGTYSCDGLSGKAVSCGMIFELSPPGAAGGTWTKARLLVRNHQGRRRP
jgi:hypothetical protein